MDVGAWGTSRVQKYVKGSQKRRRKIRLTKWKTEDSEGIGRITEDIRAAETTVKSKTANLQLTVLTEGSPDQQMEAKFLRHWSV